MNFKAIVMLAEYCEDAELVWESGISTINPRTQNFYDNVKKFRCSIDGTIIKPKLFLESEDGTKQLLTSTVKHVIISQGYARVTTKNTVYHFWNAKRANEVGNAIAKAKAEAERVTLERYSYNSYIAEEE